MQYCNSTLNAIATISHDDPYQSLDKVVARIIQDIASAVERVEEGEAQLLREASDPDEADDIRKVIRILKLNCTGNLSWR